MLPPNTQSNWTLLRRDGFSPLTSVRLSSSAPRAIWSCGYRKESSAIGGLWLGVPLRLYTRWYWLFLWHQLGYAGSLISVTNTRQTGGREDEKGNKPREVWFRSTQVPLSRWLLLSFHGTWATGSSPGRGVLRLKLLLQALAPLAGNEDKHAL